MRGGFQVGSLECCHFQVTNKECFIMLTPIYITCDTHCVKVKFLLRFFYILCDKNVFCIIEPVFVKI